MIKLYLASSSPRRQALLKQIGLHFQTLIADIDETPTNNESPADYVKRLAIAKAQAGLTNLNANEQTSACILAADTIVSINNQILGKPLNKQHAVTMLMSLSDKTHQVFTAIALYYKRQVYYKIVTTEVTMRNISEQEAIAYWQTKEPIDKAGGYAIQGIAAIFIKYIKGDYYNVVGLPLCATTLLLQQVGIFPLTNKRLLNEY